jgi:hypothetical protein
MEKLISGTRYKYKLLEQFPITKKVVDNLYQQLKHVNGTGVAGILSTVAINIKPATSPTEPHFHKKTMMAFSANQIGFQYIPYKSCR